MDRLRKESRWRCASLCRRCDRWQCDGTETRAPAFDRTLLMHIFLKGGNMRRFVSLVLGLLSHSHMVTPKELSNPGWP